MTPSQDKPDSDRDYMDALHAFALDKWGTTNPILVPDDEKALQEAYYRATRTGGAVAENEQLRALLTEALTAQPKARFP